MVESSQAKQSKAKQSNLFNVNNRGVLVQTPEPEAYDKLLDNNPDQIEILEMLVLEEREKLAYPEKKLVEQGLHKEMFPENYKEDINQMNLWRESRL